MSISERLVAIREKNGYTRRRLAAELNRPYPTITKYETGEREPGHVYIIEIAQKFHVSTDYLLGLTDDDSPKYFTPIDPQQTRLIECYEQLNDEGKEKLVDYADDLVRSGKYIKSDQAGLAAKEA